MLPASQTGLNGAWSLSFTLGDVNPLTPLVDVRAHMFRPQTWLNRGFGLHPASVARRSSTHVKVRPVVAFHVNRGNATLQFAVLRASVPGHGVASLSSTRVREAWFAPGAVHWPAAP